jgi:hypothetical protein
VPTYEYYRDGHLVERVQLEPGGLEDTRVGCAVLEREKTGAVDGWYSAGTYPPEPDEHPEPATRPATDPTPEQPDQVPAGTAHPTTPRRARVKKE